MEHPFLRSWKSVLIYTLLWTLIASVHTASLVFFYKQPILFAITDGLISNLIFAFLGIGIWYIIRYSRASLLSTFFNHIITLLFVLGCWISVTNLILLDTFESNAQLRQFTWGEIPWKVLLGIFFYVMLSLIYYLLIYYTNLQEKVTNEIQLQEKIKEAELNLLKSQINPHFLFNSLNSISSLTLTDCEKAQDMIIKLSEYLRYSVSSPVNKLSTFRAEQQNILRYLEIEKIRFGSRLVYIFNISNEIMDWSIPAMILQPLYENAIKHGVYESTEPIELITTSKIQNNILTLTISNTVMENSKTQKGAGIGLRNIRERMKLIYGMENLLQIQKKDLQFQVEISFPEIIAE